MMTKFKEFPLTVEEVRGMIKKEKSSKYVWVGIAIGVIMALVGVIIWLAKKNCKDVEEHYEYFDDMDDDKDYDDFEDFDDDLYEDDDQVEYVKIKDFMDYADDEQETTKKEVEEAPEEN